mgnify:CR=1 FL=1
MEQNGWIALGAASALALGVLAGGAVSAATAMPLADSSARVGVAPISDLRDDVKYFAGVDQVRGELPGGSPDPAGTAPQTGSPAPVESRDPAIEESPAPPPVPVAPAPGPVSIGTPPSVGDEPHDEPDDDD